MELSHGVLGHDARSNIIPGVSVHVVHRLIFDILLDHVPEPEKQIRGLSHLTKWIPAKFIINNILI